MRGDGWARKWTAVRRRQNEAADSAATEGVYTAAAMAERGNSEPRIYITRYDRSDRSDGRNMMQQENGAWGVRICNHITAHA